MSVGGSNCQGVSLSKTRMATKFQKVLLYVIMRHFTLFGLLPKLLCIRPTLACEFPPELQLNMLTQPSALFAYFTIKDPDVVIILCPAQWIFDNQKP